MNMGNACSSCGTFGIAKLRELKSLTTCWLRPGNNCRTSQAEEKKPAAASKGQKSSTLGLRLGIMERSKDDPS
jgi:hypothetical protein